MKGTSIFAKYKRQGIYEVHKEIRYLLRIIQTYKYLLSTEYCLCLLWYCLLPESDHDTININLSLHENLRT